MVNEEGVGFKSGPRTARLPYGITVLRLLGSRAVLAANVPGRERDLPSHHSAGRPGRLRDDLRRRHRGRFSD